MDKQYIPRREWEAFFQSFSRERAGWEVTVEVERVMEARAGRERIMDGAGLRGIALDGGEPRLARMVIRAVATSCEVLHVIAEPMTLAFTELCSGPAGLQIDSPAGRTRIYLRPFPPMDRGGADGRSCDEFDASTGADGECGLGRARRGGARLATEPRGPCRATTKGV